MTLTADRNFDDLAHRFRRNVYDRQKGEIRLAVLKRDLGEGIPCFRGLVEPAPTTENPLRVLDAGGGQGQFSAELAALGHRVDLCDISANMLQLARERILERALEDRVDLIHDSIQNHCQENPACYDVVLCHAVLEWVPEPEELLTVLLKALKPGGYLSLTFYNVNGIIMKNLLRTNFAKVIDNDYQGYRGSLTPTFPRKTEDVLGWLGAHPLELMQHSGIRCFHDYILDPEGRNASPDQQLALELRLSREEPFRSLGRYIHLLCHKRP